MAERTSAETLRDLRTRYPQYQDLSDAVLAQKLIAKYPEYQDMLGTVAASPKTTYTFGQHVQSAIESVAIPAGATIGGVGGALLGGMAGGIGAIPGGVAGAVLGGGAGATVADLTRPYLAPPGAGPALSLSQQVGQQAQRTGQGMLTGLEGELMGQGIGAGLKAVAAPLAAKISPLARPAQEAVPGLRLTPAQATQSRAIDILENVAEASLLGGGRIQGFKGQQQTLIKTTAEHLAESLGQRATAAEVGQVFQGAVQKSREAFHAVAGSLYREVDRLIPSVSAPSGLPANAVDLRALKADASAMLTRRGAIPKSLSSETGMQILTDLSTLPDQTTFANAQLMRSQLLKGARSKDLADIETGLARKFAGVLDEAMEGAARTLSGEAGDAWRTANAFYKSGVEQFNNKFVQSLLKKAPEKVAESIFQRGGVTLIRQARGAVDEATWREVQGAFLRRTIQDATEPVTGMLGGRALEQRLFSKTGVGTEVLDTALGNETRRKLQGLVDALRITQDRPSEGTGRIFIQLKQAGAATDVAGAAITFGVGFPKTAAMIMLGPAALSRVFTNPTAIQWLTTGLTLGPGTEAGARALSQLSAFALTGPKETPESALPPTPP